MNGYCSDITRCVFVGTPSRKITSAYSVLHAAQAAGVKAGVVGATCESVDAAARRIIDDAGFGDFYPPHRSRHRNGSARRPVHGQWQQVDDCRRSCF